MLRFSTIILSLLLLATGSSTILRAQTSPLFQFLPVSETGVTFANTIIETDRWNYFSYPQLYAGNGVAVGDVNGDELPDLFFTGTQVHNRLYLNRGNFRFEDVTRTAGISDTTGLARGVNMVDIDGDHDLDIFICRVIGTNILYINDGTGRFTDRAKQFGVNYIGYSMQAAFLDYDLDSDLDLFLAINGQATADNYNYQGSPDKLYRNNGNGTFTDVSKKAGINDVGFALSVNIADINIDGYPDFFVANDFGEPDALFVNNRNGTFTDIRKSLIHHTSSSSMGSDIADFNNDGLLDIVTLDMYPRDHIREMKLMTMTSVHSPVFDSAQIPRNTLQLNRGNGVFSDIAGLAGVDVTDWSWASLFADFDNDGMKDLFITNGVKRDVTDRDASYRVAHWLKATEVVRMFPATLLTNFIFRNNGDLTFADYTAPWGLTQPAHSNGAAYADLDLDGDLDLVLNNIDSTAFIYRNLTSENNGNAFLRVKLAGSRLNTGGFGAHVQIYTDTLHQVIESNPTRGFLSSVDPVLHFGLGKRSMIDSLIITWPGGAMQKLTGIAVNQTITLRQKEATKPPRSARQNKRTAPTTLFTEVEKAINHSHAENAYDDLKRERLLPRRLSENGPGIAVADINNDGLDDLFLGGAQEQTGHFLLQQPNGAFTRSADSAALRQDSLSEDMGSLFFDADSDGDLDLYVVSGGVEFYDYALELQDRLYLNDGKGRFTKSSGMLPEEVASGSCVSAADFDADGDLDLFVGGRVIPGKYPLAPRSFILRNDGGRFSDVTEELAPALVKPGLVCAALWSDFDGDGRVDLVTAGEWMSIRFFRNTPAPTADASMSSTGLGSSSVRFEELTNTGLESASGWWNSLSSGDFDNDGDLDYIAGNLGLNWRYKASPAAPLAIYTTDFDGNGSLDCIMSYWDTTYRKEFPMVDRMRMMSQIPSIHAKYNTFAAYAQASVDEMFGRACLDTVHRLKATAFASSYIENLGDGRFRITPLPHLAQLAPVFGSLAEDFDGDGMLDLLLVGNFYDGPDPLVIRYDASCGLYLKGDGRGGFTPLELTESGIIARGDARGMVMLRIGKSSSSTLGAVVANNAARPQLFRRDVSASGSRLLSLDAATLGSREVATHAMIRLKDGRERRQEFPLGSGYLSQSSRLLVVTPAMESAQFFNGAKLIKEMQF